MKKEINTGHGRGQKGEGQEPHTGLLMAVSYTSVMCVIWEVKFTECKG